MVQNSGGFLEAIGNASTNHLICGVMIGGKEVDPKHVALLIRSMKLEPKGSLFRELQVRALTLSPLVSRTNLKTSEILKYLPPLPSTFDQIAGLRRRDGALDSNPAVRELMAVGLGEAINRYLDENPLDDGSTDAVKADRFFQRLHPDEFARAVEPMRPQVDRISTILINEVTSAEWVDALGSNPTRADVTSFDFLRSLLVLRTNRSDQLAGFISASYMAPGAPAVQIAKRYLEAASALSAQRNTNVFSRPEEYAKGLVRSEDQRAYVYEAILAGADFLSGAAAMDRKTMISIKRALNSDFYAAKTVAGRSPKSVVEAYEESLRESGTGTRTDFENAFIGLLIESLKLRRDRHDPLLYPMQVVTEAIKMSSGLCDSLDTMDPSLFKIPGTIPGLVTGDADGATKEMLDRFFRIAVHTWSSSRGAAIEIGSANFTLYVERVAGIACMKARFPDSASIEKIAPRVLGGADLSDRKFFKNSILPHVLYVRYGIEPPVEFWEVKPWINPRKQGDPNPFQKRIPGRGKPGNGYPPREAPAPKE